MGTYDNPLHVGVDTVSQGGEALLHVAIGTRAGVGLDRCPDGGRVSRKKTGCVSALQSRPDENVHSVIAICYCPSRRRPQRGDFYLHG